MTQILVIDDDIVMQMVLRNTLQEQGYSTIVARDGKEGIELAGKYHPALVVCDWIMPGMDGLDVCRQIKEDPSLSTTFFILLTSRSAVEDKVKALDSGADDFLAKPIEKTELIASVRAGLRLYQLNQDLQHQKQLLESELTEASEYVRSLLPTHLEGEVTIATQFIPSSQLGGDCYDFYWLDDDTLCFYLVDTSGHGVGSALHSISILNLMRSQSFGREKLFDPAAVANELNRAFQMQQQGGRYFTMWYGVYRRSQRQLAYTNAGHPPGLSISGNGTEIVKLSSNSLPIGFFPESEYTSAELTIAPDSSLYIFSDGIFEVMQSNNKVWGLPKFIDLLSKELSKELSGDRVLRAEWVLQHIQQEHPNATFDDDVSLLQLNFP